MPARLMALEQRIEDLIEGKTAPSGGDGTGGANRGEAKPSSGDATIPVNTPKKTEVVLHEVKGFFGKQQMQVVESGILGTVKNSVGPVLYDQLQRMIGYHGKNDTTVVLKISSQTMPAKNITYTLVNNQKIGENDFELGDAAEFLKGKIHGIGDAMAKEFKTADSRFEKRQRSNKGLYLASMFNNLSIARALFSSKSKQQLIFLQVPNWYTNVMPSSVYFGTQNEAFEGLNRGVPDSQYAGQTLVIKANFEFEVEVVQPQHDDPTEAAQETLEKGFFARFYEDKVMLQQIENLIMNRINNMGMDSDTYKKALEEFKFNFIEATNSTISTIPKTIPKTIPRRKKFAGRLYDDDDDDDGAPPTPKHDDDDDDGAPPTPKPELFKNETGSDAPPTPQPSPQKQTTPDPIVGPRGPPGPDGKSIVGPEGRPGIQGIPGKDGKDGELGTFWKIMIGGLGMLSLTGAGGAFYVHQNLDLESYDTYKERVDGIKDSLATFKATQMHTVDDIVDTLAQLSKDMPKKFTTGLENLRAEVVQSITKNTENIEKLTTKMNSYLTQETLNKEIAKIMGAVNGVKDSIKGAIDAAEKRMDKKTRRLWDEMTQGHIETLLGSYVENVYFQDALFKTISLTPNIQDRYNMLLTLERLKDNNELFKKYFDGTQTPEMETIKLEDGTILKWTLPEKAFENLYERVSNFIGSLTSTNVLEELIIKVSKQNKIDVITRDEYLKQAFLPISSEFADAINLD